MPETLTDRSRQITHQECPRRRYLGYHYPTEKGRIGIRPVRMIIPLATGIYAHAGLAELLKGNGIEKAVSVAVGDYWKEIDRRGLMIKPGEDQSYVADEQCGWVEGSLRAYDKVQLPKLLAGHKILDVETEAEIGLGEGLIMMTRRDALLEERETGFRYIQSYKTAASYDDRTASSGEHDVQGLSEMAAAEVTHGRIEGIRMEYLLKGVRKEYPEDSGVYVQYSPLIRGLIKNGITPGTDQFAWKRDWVDEFGKKRRLDYRTWSVFSAWTTTGGVRAWIDLLASGRVQPEAGNCLEQQFVQPQSYCRQEDDLRDWYSQTVAQEGRIKAVLENEPPMEDVVEHRNWLNIYWPQHKTSCDWPSACPFIDICFSVQGRIDPIGSGNYEPRVPHHEKELKLVQISGAQ